MGASYHRTSDDGRGQGWKEHFNQELSRLHAAPVDQGNWGPKRPASAVFCQAESIPSQIAKSNLPLPLVLATSGGGIQVKWSGSGVEFSVFIYSDGSLEYLLRSASGIESGSLDRIDQINAFVDRHFG